MKVYCVTNGVSSTDLDHIVYASTSKNDAELFANTFGFYDANGNTNIEVLDVVDPYLIK